MGHCALTLINKAWHLDYGYFQEMEKLQYKFFWYWYVIWKNKKISMLKCEFSFIKNQILECLLKGYIGFTDPKLQG